jgi:hypothetical protein
MSRLQPAKQPGPSTEWNNETLRLLVPVLQTSSFAKAPAGSPVCRSCSTNANLLPAGQIPKKVNQNKVASKDRGGRPHAGNCCNGPTSFKRRLVKESLSASWMVGKFMVLAFLLEGVITLYVPASWISGSLGFQSPLAILAAALLGVPAYTTSLTALPMIGGLLTQGMNPAAALAFLVAGPTTTLPAMAAVWPLVSRRVFGLYVSFSLAGAVLAGYAYSLVASLR